MKSIKNWFKKVVTADNSNNADKDKSAPAPKKRPQEGVLKEEAGTVDSEGFIAPIIGKLEHVLYFTSAPSLLDKTKAVLDSERLLTPGAVVVWDETIGRRKGAKAVPNSWWAEPGSLTVAFVLDKRSDLQTQDYLNHLAAATIRTVESFSPSEPVTFEQSNNLMMNNLRLGALCYERYADVDILIVRLNCTTSFEKAPKAFSSIATTLVEYIDIDQLPLKKSSTLCNTLLTRLMDEIPVQFNQLQEPLNDL